MYHFPNEQNYQSPFLLIENDENIQYFLVGYLLFLIVLMVFAFMYSMYCSYPSIQGDLCVTVCGARPKRIWRKRLLKLERQRDIEMSPMRYSPLSVSREIQDNTHK